MTRDSLIPMLQEIQERDGYLSQDALKKLSLKMNLPLCKIFGVATFYNQFRFSPPGKYQIQICRGTACHVKGSLTILDMLKNELKIKPGETTKDGLFGLEVVSCIGACGLAPVMAINGQFYSKIDQEKIRNVLKELRGKNG